MTKRETLLRCIESIPGTQRKREDISTKSISELKNIWKMERKKAGLSPKKFVYIHGDPGPDYDWVNHGK